MMRKRYQLRMYYVDGEKNTAGSKASEDCSTILDTLNFENVKIPIYQKQSFIFINLMQALNLVFILAFKVHFKSIVVVQYPLLGINKYIKLLLWVLRIKACKSIVLIHDIDSLRNSGSYTSLGEEISRLNLFDFVISHNNSMTAVLRENGLQNTILNLDIFDYLIGHSLKHSLLEGHLEGSIVFAGNLGKSEFLKDLGKIENINFNLFGPGYKDAECQPVNVIWKGSFPPEDLPYLIKGGFGLIWDGDSVYECNGPMGEYLKYNNPHKASLYLVSGLPVIAPRQSAIGKYILQHNIGFTIDSIADIRSVIDNIDKNKYLVMRNNVRKLRHDLLSGTNLKRSIKDTGLLGTKG